MFSFSFNIRHFFFYYQSYSFVYKKGLSSSLHEINGLKCDFLFKKIL